jgi:hypothetical protein
MSTADYEERLKNTGRNDRCPCGSGKKYKKCHAAEDEAQRSAALKALEEEAKARAAAKSEEEGDDAPEAAPADANKRTAARQKGASQTKPQSTDTKPKNMPRRKAV